MCVQRRTLSRGLFAEGINSFIRAEIHLLSGGARLITKHFASVLSGAWWGLVYEEAGTCLFI